MWGEMVERILEARESDLSMFVDENKEISAYALAGIAALYKEIVARGHKKRRETLEALVTEGFEAGGIWEQYKLLYGEMESSLRKRTEALLRADPTSFILLPEGGEEQEMDMGEASDRESDSESEEGSESAEEEEFSEEGEEDFFNEADMEAFVREAELEAEADEESSEEQYLQALIDQKRAEGGGSESEEEAEGDVEGAGFADFFGDVSQDEEEMETSSEDLEGVDPGLLSEYQRQKLEMGKKKHRLEEKLVETKPWHMQGEVMATKREKDSLLAQPLVFDQNRRIETMAQEDITASIESMLKQRIRDAAWDDVIRKEEVAAKVRKTLPELQYEKNAKSLAEEYEAQYLQAVQAQKPGAEEEYTPQQRELLKLYTDVCYKLDSLSNFYYTPKPQEKEAVEIRSRAPAIQMEDVIPTMVSEADTLAPEEIYRPDHKGAAQSKSEMTREELRTAHRRVKRKAKADIRAKEAQLKRQKRSGELVEDTKAQIAKNIRAARNVTVASVDEAIASTSGSSALFEKLSKEVRRDVNEGK